MSARSLSVFCLLVSSLLAGLPASAAAFEAPAAGGGLELVLERVESEASLGNAPVAVFDLDDTLFDSRYRTLAILRELVETDRLAERDPATAAALLGLGVDDIRYELADTFQDQGLTDPKLIERAKTFWAERFFSNDYCGFDHVIRGATSYVRALARAGARIVYLTGRDAPRMGQCTRQALRQKGFPADGASLLLMKPDKAETDADYKARMFDRIRAQGTVVAAFENEPRNLNLMKDAFAGATLVFVESIHSNKPDVPAAEAYRIRDFRKH